ncbi:hypothetical protein D3C81_1813700 [compost metagenome]
MVQSMQSFNGALVYVALNAVGAFVSYLFIVGPLRRPGDAPTVPGKSPDKPALNTIGAH